MTATSRSTSSFLALVMTVLVACGKGDGPSGTGSGSSVGSSTATGSGSGSAQASAGSAGSAATGGAGSAAAGALVSAKVTAARCDEPCLFLVDTAVADLKTAYKAGCGKDTQNLGFDDCAGLDVARNCIYAAHGKVYKKKQWKQLFAKKSWYTPDPSFQQSTFTAVETANVKELYRRGKACRRGVHISAADDARLAAWFAAFTAHARNARKPAPPLPALIMDPEGKRLDGRTFLAEIDKARASYLGMTSDGESSAVSNGELSYKGAARSYASFGVNAMWTDAIDKLGEALPGDHTKLRVILVDFDLRDNETEESTVNEGIYVFFVYDGKDQLVGTAFSTYLLD